MRRNRTIAFLAALILGAWHLTPWIGAIEVSLEENKVEKGGIGYVDMQVLFKLYPETQKAKLSFEDAMRQTEDQVNLRRAEIIGLRAEIARLQAEKDFILKTSSTPLAGMLPVQEVEMLSSTATRHAPRTTNIALSTAAAAVPGVTPKTASPPRASILPPQELDVLQSTATRRLPAIPNVSLSTAAPVAPAILPPNIPGRANTSPLIPSNVPTSSGTVVPRMAPPVLAKIQEADRTIADKTKLLETKEADFKTFEALAEKSLLDLESRKTEILLGRIYGAIQEVAKNEGISVVVDKSQILFGHHAVDLTEKVLKKLKSQNQ